MQKNILLVTASAMILVLSAFKVISAEEPREEDQAKSIAWYVAHVREARAMNQQCHDNPGMQSSLECRNALHALEISFKGGN